MRVRIERHTMWFGGKPRRPGVVVETTRERAEGILAADRKMNRPARIAILAEPEPKKVQINTADREALIGLPGIGEAMADAIIEQRPFASIEDLPGAVSGIGEATLRRLRKVAE